MAFQEPSGRRSMRRKGRYSISFQEMTEVWGRPPLNSRQSCRTPLVQAEWSASWNLDDWGLVGSIPVAQPGSCFSLRGLWKMSTGELLGEPVTSISGRFSLAAGGEELGKPRAGIL